MLGWGVFPAQGPGCKDRRHLWRIENTSLSCLDSQTLGAQKRPTEWHPEGHLWACFWKGRSIYWEEIPGRLQRAILVGKERKAAKLGAPVSILFLLFLLWKVGVAESLWRAKPQRGASEPFLPAWKLTSLAAAAFLASSIFILLRPLGPSFRGEGTSVADSSLYSWLKNFTFFDSNLPSFRPLLSVRRSTSLCCLVGLIQAWGYPKLYLSDSVETHAVGHLYSFPEFPPSLPSIADFTCGTKLDLSKSGSELDLSKSPYRRTLKKPPSVPSLVLPQFHNPLTPTSSS